MYIIVIGGGRVGYFLTRALMAQGHEVAILEKQAWVCRAINEELGSVCVQGDGCEASILEEVGTGRGDMFVAVTGDDEDNLVACQVAKHKFHVPRTIARIRNPQNETLFAKLGIDVTVSTTNIILEHIEEELPAHPLTHLLTMKDKGLEIVEVKIPHESTTIGRTVKDIALPARSFLTLIIRKGGKPVIPASDTAFEGEDQLIVATPPESEEELQTIFKGAEPPYGNGSGAHLT